MTDKQIIIDGVDVSGCGELYNGCCCDNGSFYCKDQPNCKFKLEKRGYKIEQITEFTPREELIETITHLRVLNAELESYNEQLKESQNIEIKENKILREQLKRKEQECEELAYENYELNELFDRLKAENEKLTEQLAEYTLQAALLPKFFGLSAEEIKQLATKCSKLSKTLTEIKEIAEHCINQDICTFCDYSDKCYIEDEEIPTYDVCKLILQKISECEVE